eukprot:augustus_masked-scaffold_74-processed-gene-0.15-mRNA-1 protein AED:1.00 eAED:1.00 QI:0/0/0/0/1/1/2/0/550
MATRATGTDDLVQSEVLSEVLRQQRERSRLERISKQLAEREAANEDLRTSLMEQKEANDQLQDVLRRRQEELEEREAYFNEQEAQQGERLSNLPESYENAAENEAPAHQEHPKEEERPKKYAGSAMSYRSLDPWSETGSSYVDKNANKKAYKYNYRQHTVSEGRPSGVPLVQFQLPPKLRELTQKSIINFLHDFDGIATNVPNLNIQALLTEDVTSSLRHRGVDVTSSFSIYKYLKKHVSKFDRINRARCLTNLAEELEWPSRSLSPEEQIYLYFDSVNKILRFLTESEMDQHRKRIVKILLKKAPTSIHLELDELMLGAKHLNLPRIKQAFMNNRSGLKSFTKKQVVVHKQEPSKNRRNKNNRVFSIKVGKIGASRQDISLSLKNIHSNNFESVQGIVDTGASRNSGDVLNKNTHQELVAAINPIPIEDVDSGHFDRLDDDPSPSEVTPLVIQNLVDNIPEEFNEVGIGEGAIEEEVENNILIQMIQEKLNESIFNAEQKQDLKAILLNGIPALGIKQSNARISSLTPIDVDLVKDHPILRSDGYHQTK